MADHEPTRLKINIDFGDSAQKLGQLAATAHGLKITLERLEAHLQNLEDRARELPRKIAEGAGAGTKR